MIPSPGEAATEAPLHTADFDFVLPPGLIAQHPAVPRESARLLCVDASMADRHVRDLPDLLRAGDLLVANDTRVIPAQLWAKRGAARIGITLDRPLADGTWHALARNARRLHLGDHLAFEGGDGFSAEVTARDDDGGVALRFDRAGAAFSAALTPPARWPCRPISRARTGRRRRTARTTRRCSRPMMARWRHPPRGCISRRRCSQGWRHETSRA